MVWQLKEIRPEGIAWPMHEPGKPSFRLEDLTAANDIEHESDYDALADVRATIDLARLLRSAQPRLFYWALGLRDKAQVGRLLDEFRIDAHDRSSCASRASRACLSARTSVPVLNAFSCSSLIA